MKKTVILYWPEGGAVDKSAHKILAAIKPENADIFNLEEVDINLFNNYSYIIAGGSTVGAETWEEVAGNNQWTLFLNKCKKNRISFKDKKIAVFGLGDQILYPHQFVNDMYEIFHTFTQLNAIPVGKWPTEGYRFSNSKAVIDNMFVGLPLDDTNESDKTDERVNLWIRELIKQGF